MLCVMLGQGHTILTSRELMWYYACSWNVRGDFNIEFFGADLHFCHSAYITWYHVELWLAHAPACLSHFVSTVKEVWICVIQFNVKSPLISQLHAWHHVSSCDVRIVCPRPKCPPSRCGRFILYNRAICKNSRHCVPEMLKYWVIL
jgi:hypothetical protein